MEFSQNRAVFNLAIQAIKRVCLSILILSKQENRATFMITVKSRYYTTSLLCYSQYYTAFDRPQQNSIQIE